MKNKFLLILGIIVCSFLPAFADQWRLQPTFSNFLQRIIDTPKYTYILSGNQPYLPTVRDYGTPTNSLYRYDKTEKETDWLNIQNKLSNPVITAAEYNFEKAYLMVCYEDGNIDLFYDNGKVVNIPGLKVADSALSKRVNTITFVPGSNEAWLATRFGYVTVNDEKGEIGTSRILDKDITAVTAFDGKIFLGASDGLFMLEPRGASDLEKIQGFGKVNRFIRSGNKLYVYSGSEGASRVEVFHNSQTPPDNVIAIYLTGVEPVKEGIMMSGKEKVWKRTNDGKTVSFTLPKEARSHKTFSYDASKFWVDLGLDGLKQIQTKDNGTTWDPTGETILPNAANSYKSSNMEYSDKYGMLVRNHGFDYNFSSIGKHTPDLISGLKGGKWTPYSVIAKAPEKFDVFGVYEPTGLAIDPLDKDMAYSGSVLSGLFRLNLADPAKSFRIGLVTDPAVGKPEYIGETQPPSNSNIKNYTPFCTPGFDNKGYLWVPFFNIDADKQEIWYWSPDDRKATTSASTYKPLKRWDNIPNLPGANACAFLPLRNKGNENMLLISVISNVTLMIIDHKGTIENQKDDNYYTFTKNIYDQDGNIFDCNLFITFYEDPATGNVWVGTDQGVFYFNPATMDKTGDSRVTRIKVPRNDGTNLADYLLNGAWINKITVDGQGRKWFATNGGGLTCTSASGTQVLKTYTSDNSDLPSNTVYGLCYNPENNSMMISTDAGLAELLLSEASVDSDDEGGAVVYPNPVRPDYFGYVNIEGLEEGSLVKITDSAGNLVKELGFADDGTIRWDVTNLNNKRVRSGVYYVLASGGLESSGFSAAAKILVVN